MHYRTDYCAAQLNEAPQVLHIGDLRLHSQAYACRSHDTRPPVLLLGGAFQSFRSFAAEVSELLGEHPVILLDLPSQGGNLQLVPDLSLEQLADLIAAFAEELELHEDEVIELAHAIVRKRQETGPVELLVHRSQATGRR